jgi:hypothetical protein
VEIKLLQQAVLLEFVTWYYLLESEEKSRENVSSQNVSLNS